MPSRCGCHLHGLQHPESDKSLFDVNGSIRCQSDGITWELNPEGIILINFSIGKVHLFNLQKRLYTERQKAAI